MSNGKTEKWIPTYSNFLKDTFNTTLRSVDFAKSSEPVRLLINDEVAKDTQQMIKNLLPPRSIDSSTRVVLTNALYFKSSWQHLFEKYLTKPMPFWISAKEEISLPTMQTTHLFKYAHTKKMAAIELPFEGGQFSMLIVVPGAKENLETSVQMKAHEFSALRKSMTEQSVRFSMPTFINESDSVPLKNIFHALGLAECFDPIKANFSLINGALPGTEKALFISEVFHKTKIEVNESGAEAAAATAIVMALGGAFADEIPVELKADRPFFYSIIQSETGLMLFSGYYRGK